MKTLPILLRYPLITRLIPSKNKLSYPIQTKYLNIKYIIKNHHLCKTKTPSLYSDGVVDIKNFTILFFYLCKVDEKIVQEYKDLPLFQ
jgi:hypothetical protein